MNIAKLWATQRNLKRLDKIPHLLKMVENNEAFDIPIEINECEDGEYQINNGHHRVIAIWLSGREILEKHEYIVTFNKGRKRITNILNLIGEKYDSDMFMGNFSSDFNERKAG